MSMAVYAARSVYVRVHWIEWNRTYMEGHSLMHPYKNDDKHVYIISNVTSIYLYVLHVLLLLYK